MKIVLLLLPLFVAVHALPHKLQDFPGHLVENKEARVIEFDRQEPDKDGRSGIHYETNNGIQVSAITQPDENGQHTQTGAYSYFDSNGQRVAVRYVADEDGYWPEVEIPENIPAHAAEQIRRGREEHAKARAHIKKLRAEQKAALRAQRA